MINNNVANFVCKSRIKNDAYIWADAQMYAS